MEFGFEPVCDQLRAGSSYIDVEIARTCSKLVADGSKPYSITISWSQTGSKLVADRFEPALNLSATSFEPASNQIA